MTAMKRFTGNVIIPVIVAMILILGQGYAFMQSYGALTMPDADMHTQQTYAIPRPLNIDYFTRAGLHGFIPMVPFHPRIIHHQNDNIVYNFNTFY